MQRHIRRKAKRVYRKTLNLIVFLSAIIVGISLINKYSSFPVKLPFTEKLSKGTGDVASKLEPIVSWLQHWGIVILIVGIIVFSLAKLIPYYAKVRRVRNSNIHNVDSMTGDQFEEFLVIFFKQLGYPAKKTKRTRDHGADVLLEVNGQRVVVQAKREKSKISNSAVQQVVASKAIYDAEVAWVVTNSYYTDAAKELAHANNVQLWDRDRLIKELSKLNKGNTDKVA
jgi:restriction system protein